MSARAERIRFAARRLWNGTVALRAELLTAAALVAGWTLLTWGVASLTVWQVWPLSGGLLFLSLGGWKLLRTLASEGLYALTRGGKRG